MARNNPGNTLPLSDGPTRYPNPESGLFSPSQKALIELADAVLTLRPEGYNPHSEWSVATKADAREVQRTLRNPNCSMFSDMMLADGHPLAFRGRRYGYDDLPVPPTLRDLDLAARESTLHSVVISAYGIETRPATSGVDPNESWKRKAMISLWYTNGEHYAGQQLAVGDGVSGRWPDHRQVPAVFRHIISPVHIWHSPQGLHVNYDSHSTIRRPVTEEKDVFQLLRYMQEVFDSH